MNIQEVIDYMKLRPYTIRMGARSIANRLHCDDNLVREARKILQNSKKENTSKRVPKILLFDLETAPMRAYVWSRWKQDITLANYRMVASKSKPHANMSDRFCR